MNNIDRELASRDELTIEELDAVNGGSGNKAIEIKDWGFGNRVVIG
jgi:bacteriocin-like protein